MHRNGVPSDSDFDPFEDHQHTQSTSSRLRNFFSVGQRTNPPPSQPTPLSVDNKTERRDTPVTSTKTTTHATPAKIPAATTSTPAKVTPSKASAQITLNQFKITPDEIKRCLTEEKAASDSPDPIPFLIRFDLIQRDRSTSLTPEKVWTLLEVSMNPNIKKDSPADRLFHKIIGIQLDQLTKHNGTLHKLRWWNNYFQIGQDDFPHYCARAIQTEKEIEVRQLARLKPRPEPLVVPVTEQIRSEFTSLARDAGSVVSSMADSIRSAFKTR